MLVRLACLLVCAVALSGCEVIAKFDRNDIPPPTTKVPRVPIDAAVLEPEAGTIPLMDASMPEAGAALDASLDTGVPDAAAADSAVAPGDAGPDSGTASDAGSAGDAGSDAGGDSGA